MGFARAIGSMGLSVANRTARYGPWQRLPTRLGRKWIWPHRSQWQSLMSRYEPHMTAALDAHLSPGETFWDIGANVGWFSLYASKLTGKAGKVFAFEPAPDVYERLLLNTASSPNIRCEQIGVGSQNAHASFASQGVSSSASFIRDVTAINQSYLAETPIVEVTVSLRTVDALARDFGTPRLIKIDVEGYELEVLRGGSALLGEHHPALVIEVHPPQLRLSGGSEELFFSALNELGYTWTIIDRNPNGLYTIMAVSP